MFKFSRAFALALSLTMAMPAVAANGEPADTMVVAKVVLDGKTVEITYGELKRRAKSLPPQIQGQPIDKIYDPLLRSAIQMVIISHKAKKEGLDKDPEIKDKIKDCEEATLQRAYLDKKISALQTDAKLKEAYEEVIKILPNVDEVSFYQAAFTDKKKAEAFLATVKKNAGDFEKSLKESQDKDPEVKGGKVDYTKLPELPPALAEAMKNSKGGVLIDKPLEEKLGQQSVFFVVKVLEKRAAKKPTFEEAKGDLKAITMPKFVEEVVEADSKDIKVERFDLSGKPMADAPAAEAKPAAAVETKKDEPKKDEAKKDEPKKEEEKN